MTLVERTEIPAARYADRLAAARASLADHAAGALLVGVGADLRWLIGYDAMALERLTLLVVPRDGNPAMLVPRLETPRASLAPGVAASLVRLVAWDETADPFGLVPGLVGRPMGRLLASDRLWATFLLRLQAAFPGAPFGLASTALRDLRMEKDADEVAMLRAAAHAADRAVMAVARGRLVGRSEADVAREVEDRLVDEGHDRASFWIVGSGPNSASPHHEPGGRRIEAGEPVVLDIGGTVGGYGSDITRTIWIDDGNPPDPEFLRLYDVVRRANAAGAAAVRPGVACEQVDAAARSVVDEAGYGPAFLHRTGHGIGLEEHEDPYIVAGNQERLRPGHAFSIEPGIYLDGRFGARIEDIVVCGATGADVLNEAPREILIVGG